SALDLLGDLAFERGDFDEALDWWRLLVPSPSEGKRSVRRLVYPDPAGDPARYRAKQILAYHFAGQGNRARVELQAFQTLHAKAKGPLAGSEGNYFTTLEKILNDPLPTEDEPWTTYGGSLGRQTLLPVPLESRLLSQPSAWHVRFLD